MKGPSQESGDVEVSRSDHEHVDLEPNMHHDDTGVSDHLFEVGALSLQSFMKATPVS